MRQRPTAVRRLLLRQSGVATIEQLVETGLSRDTVRADVDADRWRRVGTHCVVTHNGALTRRQLLWLAVLDPPGTVALGSFTALQLRGFTFFGREPELVHVIVCRGAAYHRLPGVLVHESRRLRPADVHRVDGLPCTGSPRSAVDAAAWQPHPRYACAVLAAAVQQGLCTSRQLSDELDLVGRVRHRKPMRLAVLDIAGGAEALSEIDVGALCRRFGLQPPDRQRVHRDASGRRRYLDCEWRLADRQVVVLEVDGSHHAAVEHWEADMRRERQVVISGRRVLRATAGEVRHDQAEVAADLVAMGVPTSRLVSPPGGPSTRSG